MTTAASITTPSQAVAAMLERLTPVDTESIPWDRAVGRVVADAIRADRPSPPCDVSAMDGYALRLADVATGKLPIADRVLPGRPAPQIPAWACVQIMTGAAVPKEADIVLKREDVVEHDDHIEIPDGVDVVDGQNIRREGENAPPGAIAVAEGTLIQPPDIAAMVSFGASSATVRRRVRVAIIVTGDELLPPDVAAEPWQIRDSNGPALASLVSPCAWIDVVRRERVRDEADAVKSAIGAALAECDALLMTGGVSAGTHDFVPKALADNGCEVVFHKLPIRPGRPVLGAVGPNGQLVMGLPGNPVSVMCTARRIAAPLLRHRAGCAAAEPPTTRVELIEGDGQTLGLWWYRPIRLQRDGRATLVQSKGSGDFVSAARSDGVIEIPPDVEGVGPYPFYPWVMS